jgi:hypothetical protein
MLSWDTFDRPTALKLKKMFSDENLADNLSNQDFVDQLITSTMTSDEAQLLEDMNKVGQ